MTSVRHHLTWIAPTLVAVALIVAWLWVPLRQRLSQWQYERSKSNLAAVPNMPSEPSTVDPPPQDSKTDQAPALPAQPTIPRALNRTVPFTPQAPTGNWDKRHEEYCEEASALMVGRFFHGRDISDSSDAEAGLLELERWQIKHFGFFESTTAAETKAMIEANYDDLTVSLSTDVSVQAVKRALTDGQLVIMPAAGRGLGNPYFRQPGPIYHMLVIKGYTSTGKFITNDPGTKRGADYLYNERVLIDAIGDYNHGDPAHGEKVVLLVGKR